MSYRMAIVVALVCVGFGGPVAAQGMGSGPIQALPWSSKQRPHPGSVEKREGTADVSPQDLPHETPINAPEPKAKKDGE